MINERNIIDLYEKPFTGYCDLIDLEQLKDFLFKNPELLAGDLLEALNDRMLLNLIESHL